MMSSARLRADAQDIFMAGVRSADPGAAVIKALAFEPPVLRVGEKLYRLPENDKIYVAGCGKAAAPMAAALEHSLGSRLSGGIIIVKYGHRLALEKTAVIEAGHPIPDDAGVQGARRMIELVRRSGERDLLFFVVSGGGSALLPCPAEGLTLADKQRTTEVLLKSGAAIKDINAVRKHLSCVKGGRFAQIAAPAQLVSLILSDVVGDSVEAIASGPTAPDSSTYADCLRITRRYDAAGEIPARVMELLRRGTIGELSETPKPSDPIFERVNNVIIGSNALALTAARERAVALGYEASVVSDSIEGESRVAAKAHAERIKEIVQTKKPGARPICLLAGGETTVTVRGTGLGGRNQEFALAAAIEIEGLDGVVVLSGGTDGTDGPTDAAGGIVDGATLARAKAKNLLAAGSLENNDSYRLLAATGDLLMTGPTLTNVMDLQITLFA
jgi:hydroxypyruvate reductase